MPKKLKYAGLGIAPIAWWNDDLAELSDDVSLAECLRQAAFAGYSGIETGRRFPMDATILAPILYQYNMRVCGGWFSGLLLTNDIEAEKSRISQQLQLFKAMNAPCIIYGETSCTIQGDRTAPLASKPRLDESQIRTYGHKMTEFAQWCAEQGMPLVYHHHMGAVIETESEINLLMQNSGTALGLLFDAGHLAFAGGNILRLIDTHHKRISHVHTKDVRQSVIDTINRQRMSFLDAVIRGVFTVPGDGSLDFATIVQRLADYGYAGWFVVEAEQDPKQNPPQNMAQIGYKELVWVMALAGY